MPDNIPKVKESMIEWEIASSYIVGKFSSLTFLTFFAIQFLSRANLILFGFERVRLSGCRTFSYLL